MVIVGPPKAYAAVTGNNALAAKVQSTISDFLDARDTEAATLAETILQRADEHAAELQQYGVTMPMLIALQDSIPPYRADANARLEVAFDAALAILNDLHSPSQLTPEPPPTTTPPTP